MQRYFGRYEKGNVFLCEDDIYHLTHVMRAKPGTEFEVVSDDKVLLCKTTNFNPLKIEMIRQIDENNELPNKVILLASLVKGEKMDLILQKATELGVSEIVLVETERTVVKINNANKLERFRKILKEASEQCKRNKIPVLDKVIKFNDLKQVDADIKLIAYENEKGSTKNFNEIVKNIKSDESVAILIGPEGGFSQKEVDNANNLGYVSVGLGKRILRAETAVFYTLSIIANSLENK